ncbi:cofactor assembly of complex C subunit B [Leptothermofonsia sp. ETS-13]|uniref:cofactor assembly of complex C subunit B n=1 Tax=Leptothermofonsia sp. ETS-13 TaxID=3035696 RepID=UPI003BA2651C
MDISVLSSTFLLTLLLSIGLLFFIRASVKDRTQMMKLVSTQSEELTLEQLQQYFAGRAYQVASINEARNQVTFEGIVRPSLFLAFFLTLLAAIGVLCLALVLSILLPQLTWALMGMVLFAPAAGAFYWRGARRPEKVFLKVDALESSSESVRSIVTVMAHRDEIKELQRSLALVPTEQAINLKML